MVVQGENGFDIFPFPVIRGNASTTVYRLKGYQIVYCSQSLCFGQWARGQSIDSLFDWLDLSDTMQPVSYPGPVDNVGKSLIILGLDENKER